MEALALERKAEQNRELKERLAAAEERTECYYSCSLLST